MIMPLLTLENLNLLNSGITLYFEIAILFSLHYFEIAVLYITTFSYVTVLFFQNADDDED